MNLRKNQEAIELKILSPYATKSSDSKGRLREEEKCDIRTEFQRDRDRIIHSKSFRRLKHKTQVFISPEGDHYRTRLTHTLEVAQIARTIARALKLNEDLTEAIALGHDLGHTPFGHSGEMVLNELYKDGFEHCKQSLRMVDLLEKNGEGLNLTWEVRNGILNHRTSGKPETLEGKVVQISDKIAYINHDIDDAIRAGALFKNEIPIYTIEILGDTHSKRINSMIRDIIENSFEKPDIIMSDKMKVTMKELRNFMFKKVYRSENALNQEKKVRRLISCLYYYYLENPMEMRNEFVNLILNGEENDKVVCDYIACMTDRFAIKVFNDINIPISGVSF